MKKSKSNTMDGLAECLGAARAVAYIIVAIMGKLAKSGAGAEKALREQTRLFIRDMFDRNCEVALDGIYTASDARDAHHKSIAALDRQINLMRKVRERQEKKYRDEYDKAKKAAELKDKYGPVDAPMYFEHPEYKKTSEVIEKLEAERSELFNKSGDVYEAANAALRAFGDAMSNTMPSEVRSSIDGIIQGFVLIGFNAKPVGEYVTPAHEEDDEEDDDKKLEEEAEKIFTAPPTPNADVVVLEAKPVEPAK